MNAHPEEDFQVTVATHLDKFLPEPYWYTALDHTYHGERRGARLRQMGVKRGVLDMLILGPERFIGWIENKSLKGILTPEQKLMIPMLLAFGHRTAVCRTLEDVIAAVASWGIHWLTVPISTERIRRGIIGQAFVDESWQEIWPVSDNLGRKRRLKPALAVGQARASE